MSDYIGPLREWPEEDRDLGRYILVGQTPVREPDPLKWARWFEDNDRRVRLTRVGPYTVSTVFLGLDHNHARFFPGGDERPLLFETLAWIDGIPPEPLDEEMLREMGPELRPIMERMQRWKEKESRDWLDIQERCSTWLEAEVQHEAVVAQVRETGDEVQQLFPAAIEGVVVDL